MAEFMSNLPVLSTVLQVVGNASAGAAANASGQFVGAQYDQAAGQALASSQRQAIEERRQTALLQSALRARAGGGSTDPTVVSLAEDIAGQGEYRALSALYQGSDRAAGYRMAADARRSEGSNAETASWLTGAGTMFKAGPTLMQKYAPSNDFAKQGKY